VHQFFLLQAISQHGPFAPHIAPLWGLAGAGEQIDAEFHLVYQCMPQREKKKKVDRGIGKQESRQILWQTGVFVPVGSGKSAFCIT
jgi:hypothetical protein